MKGRSAIFEALARHYEQTQAGRTGQASRDVIVDVEKLLKSAGVEEGEARALAEQQLREAETMGHLKIEPLHKRDRSSLDQVRISPGNEDRLFEYLGQASPRSRRAALAQQFTTAGLLEAPPKWKEAWQRWCEKMQQAALAGGPVDPFDREASPSNATLLAPCKRVSRVRVPCPF